jgi:hypothetical protein
MKLTNRQPNLQYKVKHRLHPLSKAQRVRMFIGNPQRFLDRLAITLNIFFIFIVLLITIYLAGDLL